MKDNRELQFGPFPITTREVELVINQKYIKFNSTVVIKGIYDDKEVLLGNGSSEILFGYGFDNGEPNYGNLDNLTVSITETAPQNPGEHSNYSVDIGSNYESVSTLIGKLILEASAPGSNTSTTQNEDYSDGVKQYDFTTGFGNIAIGEYNIRLKVEFVTGNIGSTSIISTSVLLPYSRLSNKFVPLEYGVINSTPTREFVINKYDTQSFDKLDNLKNSDLHRLNTSSINYSIINQDGNTIVGPNTDNVAIDEGDDLTATFTLVEDSRPGQSASSSETVVKTYNITEVKNISQGSDPNLADPVVMYTEEYNGRDPSNGNVIDENGDIVLPEVASPEDQPKNTYKYTYSSNQNKRLDVSLLKSSGLRGNVVELFGTSRFKSFDVYTLEDQGGDTTRTFKVHIVKARLNKDYDPKTGSATENLNVQELFRLCGNSINTAAEPTTGVSPGNLILLERQVYTQQVTDLELTSLEPISMDNITNTVTQYPKKGTVTMDSEIGELQPGLYAILIENDADNSMFITTLRNGSSFLPLQITTNVALYNGVRFNPNEFESLLNEQALQDAGTDVNIQEVESEIWDHSFYGLYNMEFEDVDEEQKTTTVVTPGVPGTNYDLQLNTITVSHLFGDGSRSDIEYPQVDPSGRNIYELGLPPTILNATLDLCGTILDLCGNQFVDVNVTIENNYTDGEGMRIVLVISHSVDQDTTGLDVPVVTIYDLPATTGMRIYSLNISELIIGAEKYQSLIKSIQTNQNISISVTVMNEIGHNTSTFNFRGQNSLLEIVA
jgi:hypothetical protein